MKVKLSGFDPKAFLVEHIEKIVCAGVVVVVLLLIWQGVSLEVYPKTPQQLTQEAQRVRDAVSNAKWEEFHQANLAKAAAPVAAEGAAEPTPEDRPLTSVDYVVRANDARKPIPTLPIAPHNPPIEPILMNRREPTLFAATDLEAVAGAGSIAQYVDPLMAAPGAPVAAGEAAENGRPRRPRPTRPGEPVPPPGAAPEAPRMSAAERARKKKERASGNAAYAMQMMGSGSGSYTPPPMPGSMTMSGSTSMPTPMPGGYGSGMPNMSFGNSKPKGYRWVCITAPVPITKQQLEFFDKLGLTSQTIRPSDYVQYSNFEIQCAELPNDRAKPQEGDWKTVDLNQLVDEMDTWAEVEAPEVVDPMVTDPSLTAWLPPRLDRTWGRDVVHSQFQDFMLTTKEMLEEQVNAVKEVEAEKPEDEPAPTTANPFLRDGMKRRRSGGMPTPEMGYGSGGPVGMPGGMGMAGGMAGNGAAGSDFVMFRFFHFFVEEGKNYTYRVRLSLRNPNYMQPAKNLENPEAAKAELMTTPWSEPSPVVSIPKSGNLLVSGLTKNDKGLPIMPLLSKETEVAVIVRQWDKDTGVVAAKNLSMTRGRAGVFPKTPDVVYPDPATHKTDKKTVDFDAGLQLVDFFGGTRLRARSMAVEPCDMAFIDENGAVVIRSELTDRSSFADEEKSIKELEGVVDPNNPMGGPPGFNVAPPVDPFGVPIPQSGGARPRER